MILDLFPTPVYRGKVYIPESDFADIKSCVKYKRNPPDNGFISDDRYILNSYGTLKKQVEGHVSEYAHNVIGVEESISMKIMNSWVMSHVRGDFAPNHYHTNSLISGVLYLRVPDGSGGISFVKDTGDQDILSRTINVAKVDNDYNRGQRDIKVSDGDILLFPSRLMHYVPVSETDEMRFCLAFNVMPDEVVGDDETLNLLSFN
jgi:uncharacterized protein (TIGR02466 family)